MIDQYSLRLINKHYYSNYTRKDFTFFERVFCPLYSRFELHFVIDGAIELLIERKSKSGSYLQA
jgi:hypothetical protein